MIEIALYQPDIAPNAATIARLCACFGIKLTIISPAGFVLSDSSFKRAGMDYLDRVELVISPSFAAFMADNHRRRIVLLTTRAKTSYFNFQFADQDILLLGRESAGVPELVAKAVPDHIAIPMKADMRSLNVAIAAGIVCAEALRQLQLFNPLTHELF